MAVEMKQEDRMELLTKKDRNKLWRRYIQYNAPGFDYVYYMGKSWPWWLKPFFKKYCSEDEYKESMARHFDFYNTEGATGSLLFGMILGLEERRVLKRDVDMETIRSLKVGLQGPIAGIGDSLIQATLIPILITIALSLCGDSGNVAGPLFYLVAIAGILVPYSYILFNKGYQLGKKSFEVISKNSLSHLTQAVAMFGILIVGCLSAQRCGVTLGIKFEVNGVETKLLDMINSIFPNLLSLLYTFFLYYLIKYKKVASTWLVYGTIIGVVVLSVIGIV